MFFNFKRFHVIVKSLCLKKNCTHSNINLLSTTAMPKSNKNKSKGDDKSNVIVFNNLPVYCNKDGSIEIRIVAKPGAKVSCVTGVEEEGVGVQISAPPVDGEANEELVKFISKTLDIRKSCVSLSKGSKSRQKTLLLSDCSFTVEDVLSKLKSQIDS